ncbi:hypothetical protein AZG88_25100 [Rhodococcus sp. LB1]|nr:hypothetical protein AZG88_25100 [Rhodococcus sp. LB1]
MHPAFQPRIPDRALYQLPPEWFHISSGPVYGRVNVRPGDNDLLSGDAPPFGIRVKLHGRVLDSDGRGVPNTLIEIWQANSAGRYLDQYCNRPWLPRDDNFTGAGRCLTDAQGRYSFSTIRPSGYAGPEGTGMWRAAHVHFSLFGPDLANRVVTACYFENDPLNATDFVLRQQNDWRNRDRLIARFDPDETGLDGKYLRQAYKWDIVLRGPAATPREH